MWYEIERSFALFELGLKCVTAEYDIKEADKIGIVNKGVEITYVFLITRHRKLGFLV